MNKIKIELFEGDAEILSFESDGSDAVKFSFTESYNGFLSIDSIVSHVVEGECTVDLRLISSGEFAPILILEGGSINLPGIVKVGKKLRLSECDPDFIRRISIRERRLAKRVKTLESEVEKLKESIYKNTIF